MNKKGFILIAIVIVVLGFIYCFHISSQNQLPMEKIEKGGGQDFYETTESHTFIPD